MRRQRRLDRPGSPLIYLTNCGNSEELFAKDGLPSFNSSYARLSPVKSLWPTAAAKRTGYPQSRAEAVDSRPVLISAANTQVLKRCREFRALSPPLERFCHGWYLASDLDDQKVLRAVCQIAPEDAVLAGETAALVFGVDMRESCRLGSEYRVCMVRPTGKRALRRPGIQCRIAEVLPGDTITYRGLRVTSPLRTAVDLGCSLPLDIATRLIEMFLEKGMVTRKMLRARAELLRGRRGIRTLRQAIANADERSESPLETAVRLRMNDAGLPAPQLQVKVRLPEDNVVRRIDLGWPNAEPRPIGVEVQSVTYHPSTGPKFAADQRRLRGLERQGWNMVEIHTRDLKGREPTFEIALANMLGAAPTRRLRKDWSVSRWDRRHNMWRQDPAELWRLFVPGVGNLA